MQASHQGFLGGLVEPLFQHINDQDGSVFHFQFGEQADQSLKGGDRGAVLDQPSQRPINARLEGRIVVQQEPGRGAALGQPIQTEERCPRQRFGYAPGQLGLAAAERTNDVVQRADVLQFKTFASPGPRKIERDAEAGGRSQQVREFAGSRCPPVAEVGPQAADFIDRAEELMNPAFERGLVRGKCRFKTSRSRLPTRAPLG